MNTLSALSIAATLVLAGTAQAAVVHNSDIAGNVIFGSGNPDGGWTINQTGNMELALRAKVRYDLASDSPQPIFNANGDGTFNHAAGSPAANPTRARWNFEWSVNTDVSGTGGTTIDDYNFVLGIDSNAGAAASFSSYSLLGVPLTAGAPYDHTFGDNTTAQGGGTKATTAALFASLITTSSLMQNSSNMDFVDDGAVFASDFNPLIDGNYSFFLEAYDRAGTLIGRTDITVIVGNGAAVPVPGTLALASLGLLAAGVVRRRRR